MANKHYRKFPSSGAPTGKHGEKHEKTPERTAEWPGVPGATQPRDRSAGVKKVKGHVVKKGI